MINLFEELSGRGKNPTPRSPTTTKPLSQENFGKF